MRYCLLAFAFLATASLQAQQTADAVYVVTYVEALPAASSPATAALQRYRDATRREPGNVRADALQRREHPHHFALVEVWKDQQALDAHRQASHVTALRATLQASQLAPLDERVLKPLAGSTAPDAAGPKTGSTSGQGSARPARDAVYVLTHADSLPPANRASDALKALTEASRREPGNLSFEFLPQANRGNHFTIIEAWTDAHAHDAHLAAPHTRQFRDAFGTVTGALYDERSYRLLR